MTSTASSRKMRRIRTILAAEMLWAGTHIEVCPLEREVKAIE